MESWTEPLSAALVADEQEDSGRTNLVISALVARLAASRAEASALLEVVLARDVGEAVRSAMRHHLAGFQALVADRDMEAGAS